MTCAAAGAPPSPVGCSNMAHLSHWLAERGMTANDIVDETIAEFAAPAPASRYRHNDGVGVMLAAKPGGPGRGRRHNFGTGRARWRPRPCRGTRTPRTS